MKAQNPDSLASFETMLNFRLYADRIKKRFDYLLPDRIAANINLDARSYHDKLPRYIMYDGYEFAVGFMRFGACPKIMIESDLKGNPDALALLGQHYLPGRGCAIPAVMLQEQYQKKVFASAFGMEMFTKILPWYATNPEAPKYPEGQLGQVYVTHRVEQLATAKLVAKLQANPRFAVINLGDFMSGEQKKVAYLVQFVEDKKTEAEASE